MERGRTWIVLGALLAAVAVGAGALGAHALEARLDAARLANWETAVRYQLAHALALVLFGLWRNQGGRGRAVGWLFVLGTLGFSGSIYCLAFEFGTSWVWPLTPLGGTLLLVGWIWWALGAWRTT
ncbi:MAG: DUF423 domain-containing protein [Planctomycetota bacterium]